MSTVPKFYLDKLPRCEYEVEEAYLPGEISTKLCHEPATYRASWFYPGAYPSDEPEEMYLCDDHVTRVEEAEAEEVEDTEAESTSDAKQDPQSKE